MPHQSDSPDQRDSLDYFFNFFAKGGKALAAIDAALLIILERLNIMSTQLDTLAAQVAATKTIEDSAIALLVGLKTSLDAAIASGDPAQLQALSDALASDNAALADAITANTPAA